MARYTLFLTQRCNLRCAYCYIGKSQAIMSPALAATIVDFIFARTPAEEKIDIGFFGGEPLLELGLLLAVTGLIESHPSYPSRSVVLSVTTNGTLLTDKIAELLAARGIQVCISCDGAPAVHDRFRRFADGEPSSALVERGMRVAVRQLPAVRVNAVFRPETLAQLPDTVAYFADMGVDQIYLNPDFSARWSHADLADLYEVYARVGALYQQWHRAGTPRFVSLIDAKIATILTGGYRPENRCQMGVKELAFSPDGHVFPCERLVGDGGASPHCIGTVAEGISTCAECQSRWSTLSINAECQDCGIKDYCMRWCGCSNYMASGRYDTVSPFLCASERAAVRVAFEVFQTLSDSLGVRFVRNLIAWQHSSASGDRKGRATARQDS
jgi:uncharacterized protein